jgi:integrase
MNQLTATQQAGPDLHQMIDRAELQPSTRLKYKTALDGYLSAGNSLSNPDQLADYAAGLPKSGRAFLKAVVRLWTRHMASQTKAGATPENVAAVTATLYRLDSINEAITNTTSKGEKAHNWLSPADVRKLLATCDASPLGVRDRVVLSLLVGAGLRRAELAGLDFSHITWQPGKGGKLRTVLNVTGKGDKARIIPISDALANLIDQWHKPTGGRGRIARKIYKSGRLGGGLSESAIFKIVNEHGKAAFKRDDLAPHDLRRTFAQIGYEAGVGIVQISRLLGHSSVQTTQRYLNLDLDLETTASDFVPLG